MISEIPAYVLDVQRRTFDYFWKGSHPHTGLPRDRLRSDGQPIHEITSVAGVGFAFLAIVVGAYRGWITHEEALIRGHQMLTSLSRVMRYHGAFPHFINTATTETIPFAKMDDGGDIVETALLAQGLIAVRQYFSGNMLPEHRLNNMITQIVDDIEWDWYTKADAGPIYWHWSPSHKWALNLPVTGWNEALICYVLAAGSKTHPIDPLSYHEGWARSGAIVNGNEYLGVRLPLGEPFGGPLFLSQYSFCGLDPHGLRDQYCADYFNQVRAHSLINYRHCREHYDGRFGWGLTACDGPAGYCVNSPVSDSGIIAPTAAISSLPFMPEEACEATRTFLEWENGRLVGRFGLMDSFEPATGWVSGTHLAIDQGPIVAMTENHRSGLLWRLVMDAPEIQRGLHNLGFDIEGGKLDAA